MTTFRGGQLNWRNRIICRDEKMLLIFVNDEQLSIWKMTRQTLPNLIWAVGMIGDLDTRLDVKLTQFRCTLENCQQFFRRNIRTGQALVRSSEPKGLHHGKIRSPDVASRPSNLVDFKTICRIWLCNTLVKMAMATSLQWRNIQQRSKGAMFAFGWVFFA